MKPGLRDAPLPAFRGRSRLCARLAATATLLASAACGAAPQTDPAFGVVTLRGVTYRLPADVFVGGVAYQGPQDSLLLELPLPQVDGDVGIGRTRVLLNAIEARDDGERNRHVQSSIALNARIAVSLNPRNPRIFTPEPRPAPDAPNGLQQVATDPSDSIGDDVFVRPPLSRVEEFVQCDRPDAKDSTDRPACSQQFAGPGFTVEATYPRAALSRWNAIQQSVLIYLQHRGADR